MEFPDTTDPSTIILGAMMSERTQLISYLKRLLETLSQVDASTELVRPDLGSADF